MGNTRCQARRTSRADAMDESTPSQQQQQLSSARHQGVRHSSRRVCFIDGLASVEVQSIMHLLDRASLLALARCSRRLHSDADADLAWKHQSVPKVTLPIDGMDIGARIRGSLIRHCSGVSVDLDLSPMTGAFVDALHSIPRITRLCIQTHDVTAIQWSQIMQYEAMDSLRELVIAHPWRLPTGFLNQLVRLPHLHTLRLEGYLPRGDRLSSLPQLAHLTSLRLSDYDSGRSSISRLSVVVQCTGIIDLRIECPLLYGHRFREFFTSPNMSRLERLELVTFFAHGSSVYSSSWSDVPSHDFTIVFQSLTRLIYLCLDDVRSIDVMLPGVSHAPALRELLIRSSNFNLGASPDALVELLQRAPNLRVDLDKSYQRPQYTDLCPAHPRLSITPSM